MKKILIAILIVLVLTSFLAVGCGKKKGTKIVTKETTEKITDNGEEIGEVKIKADMEVSSECGDLDCFEEKFKQCEPTSVTYKLMESIVYYYEILGPKDGLCEVKSKFIANPNPEWVDKEMTCNYDNTKDFETAVKDMSTCQGPLHDLMT